MNNVLDKTRLAEKLYEINKKGASIGKQSESNKKTKIK